jgi:hypothetical protein
MRFPPHARTAVAHNNNHSHPSASAVSSQLRIRISKFLTTLASDSFLSHPRHLLPSPSHTSSIELELVTDRLPFSCSRSRSHSASRSRPTPRPLIRTNSDIRRENRTRRRTAEAAKDNKYTTSNELRGHDIILAGSKTPKQCKARWYEGPDPSIMKEWSKVRIVLSLACHWPCLISLFSDRGRETSAPCYVDANTTPWPASSPMRRLTLIHAIIHPWTIHMASFILGPCVGSSSSTHSSSGRSTRPASHWLAIFHGIIHWPTDPHGQLHPRPMRWLTLLHGIIQQTIHMASFITSALVRHPPRNHPPAGGSTWPASSSAHVSARPSPQNLPAEGPYGQLHPRSRVSTRSSTESSSGDSTIHMAGFTTNTPARPPPLNHLVGTARPA